MSDIVEILREMQQDKWCPMLVHMALSEAISEIERLHADRAYWERNANESVAALKNELAKERKDADRYRYLRDEHDKTEGRHQVFEWLEESRNWYGCNKGLDAIVDEAMKGTR